MTQSIYDRGMVREQTIWPSFIYGVANVVIEETKDIIFGLYANSYLLGHNYLEDIESENLQRLIDIYTANMSELDAEDQNLVLEIASKRYLKAIEIQIKNNVLATKTEKLGADEQEYDTKLAALDVDSQALITKQTQITLAIDRANLKNKDLEARIQLEELAQDYVAIEISQKELEVAKAELQLLLTAIKGLEIQIDITNTGLQMIAVDVTKSQLGADMAGINARITDLELEPKRVTLAQDEFNAVEYETTLMPPKNIELQAARDLHITTETVNYGVLEGKEGLVLDAKTAEQTSRMNITLYDFINRSDEKSLEEDQSSQLDIAEISVAEAIATSRKTIAQNETDIPSARLTASRTRRDAAIEAAEIMATANITSTLTHEIGSL